MDEKCQFLSLHASYLPIQVLKTSLGLVILFFEYRFGDEDIGTVFWNNGTKSQIKDQSEMQWPIQELSTCPKINFECS